jgi:hypothetical protein
VNQRTKWSAVILPALLAGCAAFSDGASGSSNDDSLNHVDDLLERVERVQVEAAVSKERAIAALDALENLAAPDFQGDPVATYATLVSATELSQKQAGVLKASVEPMKRSADSVFDKWTGDLESFGNTQMRQRSQARLEETRAHYDALLSAVVSAQISYDAFNKDLHDYTLFLGNDLNAASLAEIAEGVRDLSLRGRELDGRLDASVAAARTYVEKTALHGQLADAPPAPAPRATAKRSTSSATRRPLRGSSTSAPQPAAPADGAEAPATFTPPSPAPASNAPAAPGAAPSGGGNQR